jgi:small neutral amino acid transporter SnatA (MarC family)
MRRLLTEAVANVRILIFAVGFGLFYAGVAGFSTPAANVTAGALVMTIAVWPYVSRKG